MAWRDFPTSFRGSMILKTPSFLTSTLQNREIINSCWFKPLGLWNFVSAVLENHYTFWRHDPSRNPHLRNYLIIPLPTFFRLRSSRQYSSLSNEASKTHTSTPPPIILCSFKIYDTSSLALYFILIHHYLANLK